MLTIAIDSMEEDGCGLEGMLVAGRGEQASKQGLPCARSSGHIESSSLTYTLQHDPPRTACQIDRSID